MWDRCVLATMLRKGSLFPIYTILISLGVGISSENLSLSSFDECTKLAAIIDCNSKSANQVPSNLPEWAETLKLNKNALTDIPYFTSATNLTHLYLGHNSITSISRNALESMSNLRTLELNNNNVKEVGANDFPSNSKLQNLNLNHNDISRVENGSFNGLKGLVDLKLNRNKLSSLSTDTFRELGALRILELNKNRLRSIPGLTFKGLDSLKTLMLRQNGLEDLPDGAFFGLHKLIELYLDYNELTTVSGGWLYGLDMLSHLNVSHNKILSVPNQWSFNSHLKELDLSFNKLESITKNTFEHLTNLVLLKLDNNRISFIEEGAFEFLPSLQILDLSHNDISWVVENTNGAFASLKNLQKLSLAGNKISHISKNAFSGLVNVTYLDLSINPIASIEDKAFAKMPSLRELFANTSSLVCDCSLSWLAEWLNETNVVVKASAMNCVFPRNLRTRQVQSVSTKEFVCNRSDHPQPQITVHPVDTTALVGNNVTLRCGANSSSDSEMTFSWKMNNHRLENVYAKRLESAQSQGVAQFSDLQLIDVTTSKSGEYQCIVGNSYGVAYSKPSKLSVLVFPTIVKAPASLTVKVGAAARLECTATGYPMPKIQWQKDDGSDFPAASSKRMKIMNISPEEPFFIVSVRSEDAGVYWCIAKNAAGSVNASAVLTVQETPSFRKVTKDKEVLIGESAILECLAVGSPKPKVIWRKNGKPMTFSKRSYLAAEDQMLVITDTVMEDAGSYECELSNESGSVRGVSQLQVVRSVYVQGITYEDVVGITITTAVVSIVITSAVWVVFIHVARKNRRRVIHAIPMSPIDCKSENSSHSSKDSGTGDSTKRSYQDLLLTRSNANHTSVVSSHSESPSPVPESTLPLLTTFHPVVVDSSPYSKDTLSSKSKYNHSASLTPVHYQSKQSQMEHVSNGMFCASPASSNGIQCACLTATFKKTTNEVCDCVNHCNAVQADLDVSCYGDVGKRPCSIPVPYHTAHPVPAGCCRHHPNSYLCLYVPPSQHSIPQ